MTMSYAFRVSNCKRKLYLVLSALALFFYSVAQNSIVAENQLPGNPKSEWDISGAGSSNLQGFATDISVNKGQRISFKIRTSGNFIYNIKIYRLGYYQGNGARLINNLGNFTGANQPNPVTNTQTGLVDCGNWSVSAFWDVPSSAVSGIYIAKLTRNNNVSVTSHIVFIVRDDASTSDLYFQTSDATWQAYNNYGGYSLYVGSTSYPGGHAVKVSYNRPFLSRNGGGGGGASEDWLFNAEYPMIRFLERNGYDVSYTTNVDVARRGNLILNHKALLSVGHDEYWSAEQRANVEAARNAGVHLAFFSGNEVYWKTRWENSVDGANTAYRTLVCYKEGTVGENVCGTKCDPTTAWTGLWREGCAFPAGGGCHPENALTGQISWTEISGAIQVPATYKNLRFWRNTSVANLANGQVATLPDGTLGYEWNPEQAQYASSYPVGRIKLSETILGGQKHHLSLYRHSSGALVFGAGTVQWSWGLDNVHDRGSVAPSAVMQQATVNLFADMGAQPATLQAGLVKASASTDVTAPQTTINAPVNGSNIAVGTNVTISGVSSDVGGVVAGVEISLDGGTTWQQATGTTNWTYSWLATNAGEVTIKVRGFDDSGNMEVPGNSGSSNSITVSIGGSSQQPAYTIFQPSNAPAIPRVNDGNRAIEVGVKFRSSQNGYITGIRYYKGAGATGTRTGHLWSSVGTLLAEVVFSNESASGWQQALFASPVAISAGLTYVASYHSTSGDYAVTNPFFTQAVVNGPLRALANGEDGPNGVYRYTPTPAFPNSNYQTSNYWVDVVFTGDVGPDVTPPVVSAVAPANGATGVAVGAAVSAVFNEDIDASSVGSATFELRDASNQLVPAAVAYNASGSMAVLTPSAALAHETTYTATLKGGASGIKDVAGNALAANYSWTFTTVANTPPPSVIYTIFQPSNTPAIPRVNDGNRAIEVGVKFRSSQNGYITGIRYYKGAGATGTRTGHLWSSVGTLLAEVVFSNESASGWQQALFASPVAISAGLTYVASYHSTSGDYAVTNPFFTQAVVNGPLRALANGEDGPNGVYRYTPTPAFPNSNYRSSNYWVDVVFTPGNDNEPPVVSAVAPASGATDVAVGAAVSAVFNEDIDASSVGSATFELRNASGQLVAASVVYNAPNRLATLTPSAALAHETTYTATLKGGASGIKDVAGNALAANYSWTFTTVANTPPLPPTDGHGGPILVVSTSSNPFSHYAVEILRAEGLNHFTASDISQITAAELDKYDVVVLGEVSLTTTHTNMLTNWVNAGGTLIAFRPSTRLSDLLGITQVSGSMSDKYLLVNTTSGPGVGIVNQTIQFHGAADLYTLNGATALATLYEDATTATIYPAVTSRNVGTNGGKAIAFTYDLARSIIYTRQGNPAWSGQERDGQPGPIRSDDMFFGISPEPHWVDLEKVAIPQADEQQRLLTNIIIQGNMHRKPLPRFWFLPRGLKAAIVMTGDDHRTNATTGRFNQYLTLGPNTTQDVADWKAVRGTSYIYNSTPITNEQAMAFEAQGFEIALHVNTNCGNFTAATYQNTVTTQLSQLATQLPGISAPVTSRTHCVAWSDWVSAAKVQAQKGIRMDLNYYYWPQSWMQNRPGMFTGSGMPMRFADLDGSIIDCYQVTTQMTDETNMNYSSFCDQLLDKAIGPEGYYGVFAANMHTDVNPHPGSDQIIASAQARQIPVISAKQMLTWVDGRNGSYFGPMVWSNNQLSFSITALSGARNLKAMLPLHSDNGVALSSITRDGQSIAFTTERIKGMQYAFFDVPVGTGNYVANYNQFVQAPIQQEGPEFSEQPQEEAGLDVILQPNPSFNYFNLHIKSGNNSPVTVRILNMLGQVLQKHENLAPNTTLQVGHNLKAGTYLIEVVQRDKRKTLKGFKL